MFNLSWGDGGTFLDRTGRAGCLSHWLPARYTQHLNPGRPMKAPLSFARAAVMPGLMLVGVAACAHTGATTSGAAGGDPMLATGAVTAATENDLRANQAQPIEQILMSRVPGLWATRTAGGGLSLRIRGTTSIVGSNEPLFVIDGVPVHSGPGGNLTGISPYDIETIKVLRDAADTSMYGSRGANGVIVITTRRSGH